MVPHAVLLTIERYLDGVTQFLRCTGNFKDLVAIVCYAFACGLSCVAVCVNVLECNIEAVVVGDGLGIEDELA